MDYAKTVKWLNKRGLALTENFAVALSGYAKAYKKK